jgi:hypothetical protein
MQPSRRTAWRKAIETEPAQKTSRQRSSEGTSHYQRIMRCPDTPDRIVVCARKLGLFWVDVSKLQTRASSRSKPYWLLITGRTVRRTAPRHQKRLQFLDYILKQVRPSQHSSSCSLLQVTLCYREYLGIDGIDDRSAVYNRKQACAKA